MMAWNGDLLFFSVACSWTKFFFSDKTFLRRQRWLGMLFSFSQPSPLLGHTIFFSDKTFLRRQRWLGILFLFSSPLPGNLRRLPSLSVARISRILHKGVINACNGSTILIIKYTKKAACVLFTSILH